jgi:CheY-like chemotaxis protein
MPKLLIVDDEADVREFAASFFRKRKIEVTTAASGEETLLMLGKEHFDLLLLDIKMSGMDGIQTLEQLRKTQPDLKVVMVTGKKPEESLQQCRQFGILGYIQKPLILDELERIVLTELRK